MNDHTNNRGLHVINPTGLWPPRRTDSVIGKTGSEGILFVEQGVSRIAGLFSLNIQKKPRIVYCYPR
jgi:hypothetical protein